MKEFKLIINLVDGRKVWINLLHVLKMEITPDGRYFLFLTNGEVYPIDGRTYDVVKDYYDD